MNGGRSELPKRDSHVTKDHFPKPLLAFHSGTALQTTQRHDMGRCGERPRPRISGGAAGKL